MRTVTWTDPNGYRHRSLLRDGDADEMASQGVLLDPPDLGALDWEVVRRDLHNALVDAGLLTWQDVQRRGAEDGLRGAILSATKKRLIALYREVDNG